MPIHKENIIREASLLTKINILHKVVLQNLTFGYICDIEVFEYQLVSKALFPNHNTTYSLNKSIICIKLLFLVPFIWIYSVKSTYFRSIAHPIQEYEWEGIIKDI